MLVANTIRLCTVHTYHTVQVKGNNGGIYVQYVHSLSCSKIITHHIREELKYPVNIFLTRKSPCVFEIRIQITNLILGLCLIIKI